MAIIDIILGGLLLYGFIRGAWKGFFSELASLLSLLIGLYVAITFSDYVGDVLSENVSWDPKYISITAFAITFIAVVVGIILLGKFFTKLASFAMLGWLNKLLGGVFGFLKWALLLSVLLNFFVKINSDNLFADKKTLDNSWFFYPIVQVSSTIFPVMEEWFVDIKDDVIEGLDKSI
ncbi:MAG: hypothetical protein BM557_06525 [Flavobacterium sp. MedPE-SWcel]|uniref:CvpA family protein n=1 Tax=uncultured Flavobacterium sp. TaxID=165435 RepID=UPI0009188CDA|nr:CvpA family protein [uncultured Flavobacterium sp.]OIQ19355.1 MAG: hypothetical protein BM557_06525 [Flavobacterium sp. MedPE-SWcel]